VQAVQAWLAIAPASSHLFCTERGEPIAPQTINSMFRRLKEAAALPDGQNVNAHALRHRFAQRMLAQHDPKVVSQLMGHAEVSTTLDVYAQRDENELIRLYYND
jgi:site-specific recombinase XerD